MRRPFVRVLTRPLVLVTAVMAIPLVSAAPAASDGVVVGGFPVDVSDSPWTVALSSRDRFGGMRSGQFCGGVAVGPTTVLTAAHCMGEEVLGVPPGRAPDLTVVPGRTDLYSDTGQEIAVSEIWVNPADAVSFTLLQEQLHAVLDTLSEREAGVVSMRFGLTDGQPKTLDEIGKVYGVTRERIRQIESKTMSKLRHPSRSQVLRDYLD